MGLHNSPKKSDKTNKFVGFEKNQQNQQKQKVHQVLHFNNQPPYFNNSDLSTGMEGFQFLVTTRGGSKLKTSKT